MTQQFFDLMIDTETMGKAPDGALIQLGAVFFDYHTCTLGPRFLKNIHLATAVRDGGTLDPSTILWWLGQSDEARKVRFGGEDISDVLREFKMWAAGVCRLEDVRPWGNSNSFDLSIVRSAYERKGLEAPWYWTNERDFRTLRNHYPQVEYNPAEKGDAAHDALADAIFQAEHMFKIARSRKKVAPPVSNDITFD